MSNPGTIKITVVTPSQFFIATCNPDMTPNVFRGSTVWDGHPTSASDSDIGLGESIEVVAADAILDMGPHNPGEYGRLFVLVDTDCFGDDGYPGEDLNFSVRLLVPRLVVPRVYGIPHSDL